LFQNISIVIADIVSSKNDDPNALHATLHSHVMCCRILDLFAKIRSKFDFKSLQQGKVERFTLASFVVWWIAGVILTTKAGGIAYEALNVYFSSWGSLFGCIYGLDRWGAEKEVMTLNELTRLSPTLPWWWIVFWSSIVVFGTAADAGKLIQTESAKQSCEFAVVVGILGSFIAGFFILSHYEFFQCCCGACNSWLSYGGCFEISCSLVLILWLMIGLDNLTGAGRIGCTLTGNGLEQEHENYIPGSNIYVSIWTAFISNVIVAVKWKEARAIKFAQTAEGQAAKDETGLGNEDDDSDDDI
jgi:hypothetical protein